MNPNDTRTQSAVGGVIVLMLWFYVSGLAVLFGAEMNAETEHASPSGLAVGLAMWVGSLLWKRLKARAGMRVPSPK